MLLNLFGSFNDDDILELFVTHYWNPAYIYCSFCKYK